MDIVSMLQQSITTDGSFVWILILSFLSGVLISFTPCVYPMIPITVGIMQTQTTQSLWRSFFIGLCYVFGLATVYAVLGVISATTSILFGQWTSSPWFIFFIVLLFLYLAFSLFGFYEVRVPSFFTSGSDSVKMQRPFLKSFLLGLAAGTIASPCLTPALAMLLTLVAQKGNPVLGFFAMFLFAFGMGFLLIFVGMFSASLNFLPRAGEWMEDVKKFFGFIMLGVCVHVAKPLISSMTKSLLFLLICAVASGYYFYTAKQSKLKWFMGLYFAGLAIYLLTRIL